MAVGEKRVAIAKAGMYLAGFMAVVNISVIYLALPSIERALHAGLADQEWILSIYPLMEGGFTLAAGTLGDLYGRKRILTITTAVFVLATLGCAFAPNAASLIVLRGLQGLGGAALLSLPVAMLVDMTPAGGDSEDAIKMFSTVAGLGAVAGPVLGGILVHWFGWPSVFLLSVVFGLVVLATFPFVSESDRDPSRRLDGVGQFLSVLSFLAISFALIEGNANGWGSALIVASFAVFVVGLALFLYVEKRVKKPMIHLRYFSERPFNAGLLIIGVLNFGWYGIMLLCTLFLQNVLHQSAMNAGFYLMPSNIAFFVANQYSSRAEKRMGDRTVVAASFAISLLGIAWLATLGIASAPWEVAGGLFVAGIGWGLVFTPAAAMGMSAVASADEGFASGAIALSRSLFGVFGIAILGSLLAAGMARSVSAALAALHVPAASTAQIAGAVHHGGAFVVAANPPAGITSAALTALVSQGFVTGLHVALWICLAITLLLGALIYTITPTAKTQPAATSN
jgi:DHA2 family methylenomycin A resistance protein-like MFS transporter